MNRIFLITCLFLQLTQALSNDSPQEIMSILESWGKSNGVFISNKISLVTQSLSIKYYKTIQSIHDHELLLSIPINLLISPSSALKSSDAQIAKAHNFTYAPYSFSQDDPYFNKATKDMIFLTLLYYMSISQPNNYTSFYSPYLNSYQNDLRNFPTLYTSKELKAVGRSNFGIKAIVRNAYQSEESFLINMSFDKSLNETTYLRYRNLLNTKVHKINEEMTIVPFIDLIPLASKDKLSNCEWRLNSYTKKIEVFSNRNIAKDVSLLMNPIDTHSIPSDDHLLDYGSIPQGRTLTNAFMVDLIHHTWRETANIRYVMKEEEPKNYDLLNLTYPSEFMFAYRELAKELGVVQEEVELYRLMKKNLEFYLKDYQDMIKSEVYMEVMKDVNGKNIEMILHGEKNLISRKMYMIEQWIKEMEKGNEEVKERTHVNINEEL